MEDKEKQQIFANEKLENSEFGAFLLKQLPDLYSKSIIIIAVS